MPDLQVVQFDPKTGVASLALGTSPKMLNGIDLLKQVVALHYLKNPGQDVLDPNEGSGLRAAIGQYNFGDPAEVKLLFIQRTQVIEKDILNKQPIGVGTPEERLKKLAVLDAAYDQDTGVLVGSVQIINEAGDSTNILV